VHEVSRHLQYFYLKRGICQLTDHEYDMSMLVSAKYCIFDPP
jgi:myosin-crossreactive antigen